MYADLKNSNGPIEDQYKFPRPCDHLICTSMSEVSPPQGPDMWYLTFYQNKVLIYQAIVTNSLSFKISHMPFLYETMEQNLWSVRGSYQTIYSSSPKCCITFWRFTICIDTLHWSDITPNCDLVTKLELITFSSNSIFNNCDKFHQDICNGIACAHAPQAKS